MQHEISRVIVDLIHRVYRKGSKFRDERGMRGLAGHNRVSEPGLE